MFILFNQNVFWCVCVCEVVYKGLGICIKMYFGGLVRVWSRFEGLF